MARMALIQNGKVANVIVADQAFCDLIVSQGQADSYIEDVQEIATIGMQTESELVLLPNSN